MTVRASSDSLEMVCALTLFAASALSQATSEGSLSGTVTYRNRMALTRDAVLTVSLDRFAGSVHSNVSEVKMRLDGKQVPVSFVLPYAVPKSTDARYGVRAEIRSGDRILFASASTSMVRLGQKARLELVLVPAASDDVPRITGPLWELMALEGQAVNLDDHPPTLTFAKDGSLQGFGGVNRFGGSYVLGKGPAQIDPGPMTLMAGSPERMDVESRFVRILPLVNRAGVFEGELVLMRGEKELARFRRGKS